MEGSADGFFYEFLQNIASGNNKPDDYNAFFMFLLQLEFRFGWFCFPVKIVP